MIRYIGAAASGTALVMVLMLATSTVARGAAPAPAQAAAQTTAAPAAAGAAPIIVVETSRGTFEFETYPAEAPKTVAHIVGLVKKNFYDGIRIHRVVPGFVVQFGDPLTRDMAKKTMWGTGGSGTPIGAAEINKKHTHNKGAVAMAHAGDPSKADSQMYVTLGAPHNLDSGYTVFGQIISGMDVVEKTEQGDVIKKVTVKGAGAAAK